MAAVTNEAPFIKLHIIMGPAVKAVVEQMLSLRGDELWAALLNEPGIVDPSVLNGVTFRELFGGCACCVAANSPILRTTIAQLLKSKPRPVRLLLVLSPDAEPSRLLPMLDQYFGRYALLDSIVLCTTAKHHSEKMISKNEGAYRDQFEIADIVVGLEPTRDLFPLHPTKRLAVPIWTGLDLFERVDTSASEPQVGLVLDEGEWSQFSGLRAHGASLSCRIQTEGGAHRLALAWFVPSEIRLEASFMEKIVRELATILERCQYFEDILNVAIVAVLSSAHGGFQLVTASSRDAGSSVEVGERTENRFETDPGPDCSPFPLHVTVPRLYAHRGTSRIEIVVRFLKGENGSPNVEGLRAWITEMKELVSVAMLSSEGHSYQ